MCRRLSSFFLLAFLPACLWAAPPETSFTVQNQLQTPGEMLPAGSYTLALEENVLHDRAIVRLRNAAGNVNTLLLAVPNATLGGHPVGIVDWNTPANSQKVLRGWVLPGGNGTLEFAYPKEEAAKLANEVNKPVLAVDPASDRLPPLPSMTQDDMKVVHLWLLAYHKVGPDASGKKLTATAYKPGTGTEMAANMPPPSRLPHTAGGQYECSECGFRVHFAEGDTFPADHHPEKPWALYVGDESTIGKP